MPRFFSNKVRLRINYKFYDAPNDYSYLLTPSRYIIDAMGWKAKDTIRAFPVKNKNILCFVNETRPNLPEKRFTGRFLRAFAIKNKNTIEGYLEKIKELQRVHSFQEGPLSLIDPNYWDMQSYLQKEATIINKILESIKTKRKTLYEEIDKSDLEITKAFKKFQERVERKRQETAVQNKRLSKADLIQFHEARIQEHQQFIEDLKK